MLVPIDTDFEKLREKKKPVLLIIIKFKNIFNPSNYPF